MRTPGGKATPAAEWMRVTSMACFSVQRRQQTGKSLGQHRLAGAGRSDQQEVVPAGRRHLHREPPEGLALHVGQVRDQRLRLAAGGAARSSSGQPSSPRTMATRLRRLGVARTDSRRTRAASRAHPAGTTTRRPELRRRAAARPAPDGCCRPVPAPR